MVDIKFIAKKAGVSIATVSRVLNKTKYVSPEIEKRVMDEVVKYRYRPNGAAQALAERRPNTLGIVFSQYMNLYHSYFFKFFYQEAMDKGYNVINAFCEENEENRLKVIQDLYSKNANAILCMFSLSPETRAALGESIPMPMSLVNGASSSVQMKEEQVVYEAITYLIQLGHRKIGGLFPPVTGEEGFLLGRQSGFRKALHQAGIDPTEDFIYDGVKGIADVPQYIDRMFSSQEHPTALFCYSDECAMGAIFHLAHKGYKVPEDVSVIGYDDIPMASMLSPRLTTISVSTQEMVHGVVEQMICIAEKRERPQFNLDGIQFRLEIRESCCPPKQPDV